MGARSRGAGLGLLAALVVALLALMVWRVGSAEEVTDQVRLSVDGVRWTLTMEDAFFYSEHPWEPGEERTAMFWVRNTADVRADVHVTLRSTGGEELTHSGLLLVSASVDDGLPQPFAASRDVNTIRVGELEAGERATITLHADLGGTAVVDSSIVRYRAFGSGTRAEEPRSVLDATGANLELAPIFLAIALVATTLVMRSTRRRQAPRPED